METVKKLNNEELGMLWRKHQEIITRIEKGQISLEDSCAALQSIIIEGKSSQHLGVVRGTHTLKFNKIMLTTDPVPLRLKNFYGNEIVVKSNRNHGRIQIRSVGEKLLVDDREPLLWRFMQQLDGRGIQGIDLQEALSSVKVGNAAILDFLLDNPEIIPDDWKFDSQEKNCLIYFSGTIYHSVDENQRDFCYVRGMRWSGSKWISIIASLNDYFHDHSYFFKF